MKTRVISVLSFMAFFLYTGIATRIFRLFKCREIHGVYYLIDDYSVTCFDEVWWPYGSFAVLCIGLYVIGIPLVQYLALWYYKDNLHESAAKNLVIHRRVKKQYGSIYEHYTDECYYYDFVDLFRRLLLTGGLILVGSSIAQVFLGIMICLTWALLVAFKRPYKAYWDNILAIVLSLHLLFTLVSGMALKLYQLSEINDEYEQFVFDWMLVIMTFCSMCLAVIGLFITIPRLRKKLISCCVTKDKDDFKHNWHEIHKWVKEQKSLMKLLKVKELRVILKDAEKEMQEKAGKEHYLQVQKERLSKTKINMANIARTAAISHRKHKLIQKKVELLPCDKKIKNIEKFHEQHAKDRSKHMKTLQIDSKIKLYQKKNNNALTDQHIFQIKKHFESVDTIKINYTELNKFVKSEFGKTRRKSMKTTEVENVNHNKKNESVITSQVENVEEESHDR